MLFLSTTQYATDTYNTDWTIARICSSIDSDDLEPHTVIGTRVNFQRKHGYAPYALAVSHRKLSLIEYLSSAGLERTLLPLETYAGSLLSATCLHWSSNEPHRSKNLAKKLIQMGADLHYHHDNSRTPLENLISGDLRSPSEEQDLINEWFGLLESLKVDVTEYLSKELECSPVEFDLVIAENESAVWSCLRPRKLCFSLESTGKQRLPSVSRRLSPESPALLLLNEFDFSPEQVLTIGPPFAAFKYSGSPCEKVVPFLNRWAEETGNERYMRSHTVYKMLILWRSYQM
jgi:hypothetical protein